MIRPATAADARALAELEVRAWRWAYVDVVAEQDMITVEEREARWAESLDGAFVAEVEGRAVGLVEVGPDPDGEALGVLCGLYVEPAAQGAGIGTALYEHALSELRGAGFAHAALWIFAADEHTRGSFERRGWSADGPSRTVAEAPQLRYRHNLFT